ncbi:MAG: flagellar hook-length control protein FliK [Pseudomonas sp.]
MSTSQALMALFSTDLRSVSAEVSPQLSLTTEEGDAFAALLAEQLPAELEAVIEQLSPEQLASLEQAALAVSGNTLPAELQELLQQLPEDEADAGDAVAVIGQWIQWAQQDGTRPAPSTTATTPSAGEPVHAAATRTQAAMLTEGDAAELPDGDLPGRASQSRESATLEAARQNGAGIVQQGNQPNAQNQTVQAAQQDFGAMLQRTAVEANPTAAALFGKLVEQMEGGTAGRGDEDDALDGLQRTLAQTGTNSAALTARPVSAAMQPATVPFGHQSWGEAMVERVMWMSSQNLRSVEIQLDPAELGPLEIHIQNRGQELQVQFISQNPSVREALEGQMHRLREMFVGQGLEQTEVTVADRSAGDQSRQSEGQLAERAVNQRAAGENLAGTGEGEVAGQLVERMVQPLRGLVDYYA